MRRKSSPGWDSHQWHYATKLWSLTEVFREFFKAVLRCMKIREGCELGEAWRKVCHFVLGDVQDYQVLQPDNTLKSGEDNSLMSISFVWHSCPNCTLKMWNSDDNVHTCTSFACQNMIFTLKWLSWYNCTTKKSQSQWNISFDYTYVGGYINWTPFFKHKQLLLGTHYHTAETRYWCFLCQPHKLLNLRF